VAARPDTPDERRAVRRDAALIAAIVALTGLALGGGYAASRAMVARVTEAHALDLAREFTRSLADALSVFDPAGRYVGVRGEQQEAVYRFARDVAHIDRMVAIGADRVVAFDSRGAKTGLRYDKPYIAAALDHGRATVMFADADDADGRYVAETYVPVRAGGRVVGVFELYLDVAGYVASVEAVFRLAYTTFAAAVLLTTLAAVALVGRSLRRRLADLRRMRTLRDAAERSLEQQKRFTANAAHELRTPLAVLRARLDGLPPSPDAAALARDADRMGHLVDQLLTVARLEARQVELEDGVDLVAVARDTVAALFPLALADGKSMELAIEPDGEPDPPPHAVPVRGNAFVLEDALRNLIGNALRHTPAGGAVEVAVTPDPPALEVRDRGPGVPAALRAHLFEPFVQGRERRGGAGLGLAIVAETARLHGGTVEVEDRPGGGSVFRLRLPHPATAAAERTAADAA
jgi:signal transduction histidine kinase